MCSRIETAPGKFEGTCCIAKVAYDWMLDGMSDERGNTEESTPDVFYGPFTTPDVENENGMCPECKHDVLRANRIELYESNSGFISIEIN